MRSSKSRLIGIILAAGRGRRMGGTKQLVMLHTPAGEKPLVAAAYDAIGGACEKMVVVLGHEAQAVANALAPRSFRRVVSDPDAPMFDSIRAGLTAAEALDPAAAVLLQPGDHPHVSPQTLELLVNAGAEEPQRVIMPEFQGQGGHPVLIPPPIVRRLLVEACPAGLARFWADHPQLCRRITVDDPSVIRDIDTPEHPGA
jgi:molybdenum cofactor cytidylyltransferase